MQNLPIRRIGLVALLALYLGLACWQLGLPGLHYDEAAEAGVNAMQLLTGAPVTAFRNVTISLFGRTLPLMVQDYIGALNVYLALPFLAITGIGVPNLRILGVLIGLAALLLVERAVSEFWILDVCTQGVPAQPNDCGFASDSAPNTKAPMIELPTGPQNPKSKIQNPKSPTPLSWAGLISVALLAASPSFVLWSRQGLLVTNLTEPLCFCCLWQGVRWLRSGRPAALVWSAIAGGLAIYAKLLALWVILPFVLLAGGWWLWQRRQAPHCAAPLSLPLLSGVIVAFCLPLLPLLFFNLQTGGTIERVSSSLTASYYGVDNRAIFPNALIRGRQLLQVLRGDQFWYLGGLYGNGLAPWLAGLMILAGLWRNWRRVAPPLALLVLAFICSLFTVSDLFITHYALLQPLAVAGVAISAATLLTPLSKPHSAGSLWVRTLQATLLLGLLVWIVLDLTATVRYHAALARSGGLADHSDASYHLAYTLRYNGLGAPIVLDWGLAAPVRYLSEGTVQPIELFGYDSLSAPDAGFDERLRPFLSNPQNVYLLHTPGATVFAGRREEFGRLAAAMGRRPVLEQTFAQRNGTPLYELWRVVPGNEP